MKRILIVLACSLGMFACDDVFEKDLTKINVTIIAPSDGQSVAPGNVTFFWQEVDGASFYRIRIVGGTFDNAGLPVADTIIYNDSTGLKCNYKCNLDEGEYQWSVIAGNSSYDSRVSVNTLHVMGPKPPDISQELITVTAPHDGTVAEPGEVAFSWEEVAGADYYRFTLVSPEFGNASKVLEEIVINREDGVIYNLHKVTINDPGEYQWKLSAGNGLYETDARVLSLSISELFPPDISGVTVPVVSPVDGAEAEPGEMIFLWDEVMGASSYHLTVVGPSFPNASTVIVDKIMEVQHGLPVLTSHSVDIPAGEYEWRIRATNSHYRTIEHIYSLSVVTHEEPMEPGPDDISGKTIEVISPYNNAVLEPGEVTFLWRQLSGADSYHITIVGPTFAAAKIVLADEVVGSRTFKINLPAGRFQWSLRAINEKYATVEQVLSLEVVEPEKPKPAL